MRRIVTGHSQSGKSIFVSDGEPPRVGRLKDLPSPDMTEIWATDDIPTIPVGKGDPTLELSSLIPGPGGTRFRIMRAVPQQEYARALQAAVQKGIDPEAIRQEARTKFPGFTEVMETEHPGMHTTNTIDYGIVLSGEIWLELDDGVEVNLKPGDCVIQNGTRHAWRNKSSETCVMAFIMVGAKQT